MDIGTILLIAAITAGILDVIILLVGSKLKSYEQYSIITSSIGFFAAAGALLWMGILIFTNQFQYVYVYLVTNIDSSFLLKISALWTRQSGSLVFWTFLSFTFYFGFRLASRGYEDNKLVCRASIIMAISSVLIAVNAFVADPFRLFLGYVPTDGLGLSPILSTIYNVIHPPIMFIAYALILVPFSVKVAGYTFRSEERNKDPIHVVNAYVRFTTILAWLMLSAGIAIGGYWAYTILGWGGYWAWDPIETTSLIPWLLITGYYHAKPILKKNDVLRDSFLVMAYVSVIFATWVTRSGILSSVHGFGISIVSWTMLVTLIFTMILGIGLTIFAGYRDMPDDDDSGLFDFFKEKDMRLLSIKTAFVGLLIVTATSALGVVYPAAYNLGISFFNPADFADSQIGIRFEFFQYGLYVACAIIIASAFFCLKPAFLSIRIRGIIMLSFFAIGSIIASLTVFGGFGPLPTNFWFANLLLIPAVGAIVFLVIAFLRQMIGLDNIASTREVGRLLLHIGLIILLLGVFMSENIVYENIASYQENDTQEIAPGISIQVTDIDMHFIDDGNFTLIVSIQVIETDSNNVSRIVGIGNATYTDHSPLWEMVSHQVYLQSTVFRDVFIAVNGYTPITNSTFQAIIHTRIIPFVSFVWFGVFLMVAAMLPMFVMETQALLRAFKGKKKNVLEDSEEPMFENHDN